MLGSILSNSTFTAAKIALDGLSIRRDIIAQNIANVDTPNYLAQEVDFESTLQMALQSGESISMELTDENHLTSIGETSLFQGGTRQGGTLRADGNNVDIDLELTDLTETGIRYDAISRVVNQKYNLIKSLTTGG
jgi:flagellar basal-body rod protein FlgB